MPAGQICRFQDRSALRIHPSGDGDTNCADFLHARMEHDLVYGFSYSAQAMVGTVIGNHGAPRANDDPSVGVYQGRLDLGAADVHG